MEAILIDTSFARLIKRREEVLATLTAPLVAIVNGPQGSATRVFVVGSDNTVYAVDAATGAISWQRPFPNAMTPSVAADYRCPSTQNATPIQRWMSMAYLRRMVTARDIIGTGIARS